MHTNRILAKYNYLSHILLFLPDEDPLLQRLLIVFLQELELFLQLLCVIQNLILW